MPRKPWRKQSSWLQKASRTTQIRVSLCECHRSVPRMYSSRSGQMTGNPQVTTVQSQDMVYEVSLNILYSWGVNLADERRAVENHPALAGSHDLHPLACQCLAD